MSLQPDKAGALPLDKSLYALPWPRQLRSRILTALECCQALQIQDAIDILISLDLELGAIDRDCERGNP